MNIAQQCCILVFPRGHYRLTHWMFSFDASPFWGCLEGLGFSTPWPSARHFVPRFTSSHLRKIKIAKAQEVYHVPRHIEGSRKRDRGKRLSTFRSRHAWEWSLCFKSLPIRCTEMNPEVSKRLSSGGNHSLPFYKWWCYLLTKTFANFWDAPSEAEKLCSFLYICSCLSHQGQNQILFKARRCPESHGLRPGGFWGLCWCGPRETNWPTRSSLAKRLELAWLWYGMGPTSLWNGSLRKGGGLCLWSRAGHSGSPSAWVSQAAVDCWDRQLPMCIMCGAAQ